MSAYDWLHKWFDRMSPELMQLMRTSNGALAARAWQDLKHSAYLSPSVSGERPFHGIPRLLLWDDASSFGDERDPFTLTVFELYGDDYISRYPVVRQAIWRSSHDRHKLLDRIHEKSKKVVVVDPTIEIRDGPVPAAEFAVLLREATSFQIPVVSFDERQALITDVGAVGFEFFSREQPPAVLRLEWSFAMPANWRPIIEWHARMQKFLIECLEADKNGKSQ